MKFFAVCLVLCAGLAASAPAWGPDGHEIVAAVAQSLLNDAAQQGVSKILDGDSLASVANWADHVKNDPDYHWSEGLHYIDTPDRACTYERSRDCADSKCVDGAIQNYTQILASSSSLDSQSEALKFLTHFIGDIHQPLHVGFTSDRGGNSYTGTFLGKSRENLHSIWDSGIIKQRMTADFSGSQPSYITYLSGQVSSGNYTSMVSDWKSCSDASAPFLACSDSWAAESIKDSCQYAYKDENGQWIESGFDLEDSYYQFAVPVVDMQLAKGGVRLANVLNAVFSAVSGL